MSALAFRMVGWRLVGGDALFVHLCGDGSIDH